MPEYRLAALEAVRDGTNMPAAISLLTLLFLRTPETHETTDARANTAQEVPEPVPERRPYGGVSASPPPPPRRRGIGMIIGGALAVGPLAVPLVTFAALDFRNANLRDRDECSDCFTGLLGRILMPIGIVAVAVGIPVLTVGALRLRAWKEWQREYGLTLRPQLARSHGAWIPGLELRF